MDLSPGKYYDWKGRYGRDNDHNASVPRDHWLDDWERSAILAYHGEHPEAGYRRLTYMMMDQGIVAVSPTTTYNVLSQAGLMGKRKPAGNAKGRGFQQPEKAHDHWHVDITYLNIAGTFYYMCSVLDGFSRALVYWEIREQMKTQDVEIVLLRAKEAWPNAKPRLITDNGPQFVARDFKSFVRVCGMTHVRTSPYYPQSNGKLERWHQSLKTECIRTKTPLSIEDARRVVKAYVHEYNHHRLHSAIGYIAPIDKLNGKATQIFTRRDESLAQARKQRTLKRSRPNQAA